MPSTSSPLSGTVAVQTSWRMPGFGDSQLFPGWAEATDHAPPPLSTVAHTVRPPFESEAPPPAMLTSASVFIAQRTSVP